MKKQTLFILIFLFLNTFIPSYGQYAYPYNGQYIYPNYGQYAYPYNGQYIYPNYGYGQLGYSNGNFSKKHPVLNVLTNILGSGYLNNVGSSFGNNYGYANSYTSDQSITGNSQQAFVSGFNSLNTQNSQLPLQDNNYLGSDSLDQSDSE